MSEEFTEFLKAFTIKEIDTKDGNGKKATLWIASEKNGTYQATGLVSEAIMWELRRCYNSRNLRKVITPTAETG